MNFFDYDTFNNIISFIDDSEHIILREVNKDTKSVIDYIYHNYEHNFMFPKKKLIYSSKNFIKWAKEHSFTDIHLKRVFKYNKTLNLDVLNCIYDEFSYEDKKFNVIKFISNMIYDCEFDNKEVISVFNWLLEKLGSKEFLTEKLFLRCIFFNNIAILEYLKDNKCPYRKKDMEKVLHKVVNNYDYSLKYIYWIHGNLIEN